jgi:hypothetical protein
MIVIQSLSFPISHNYSSSTSLINPIEITIVFAIFVDGGVSLTIQAYHPSCIVCSFLSNTQDNPTKGLLKVRKVIYTDHYHLDRFHLNIVRATKLDCLEYSIVQSVRGRYYGMQRREHESSRPYGIDWHMFIRCYPFWRPLNQSA